jgi:RNA polymerase sigma factor (sigma-70 family)
MAISRLQQMIGDLRRVLAPPEPDSELLVRFLLRRDEDAFAALVQRHGAMVLGICRRVLRHEQDAEDAFQATFLILARKAGVVRRHEVLASWLYTVAQRTAQQLRAARMRLRWRERQVEELPHLAIEPVEAADWIPLLDQELSRLPEQYRAPVVLCDLRGEPRRAAALQLGVSDGTLSRRLAAGRRLLAQRLARRGVALSGAALAMALARDGAAALPAGLARATSHAALLVAAGKAALVRSPAIVLMNQVLRSMLMTKLKVGVTVLVLLVCGGEVAYRATGQSPQVERRAVSDIDLLRREIELLRNRVERLQDRVEAQQTELRALRGAANAAPQIGLESHKPVPADPTAKQVERVKVHVDPRSNRIIRITTEEKPSDPNADKGKVWEMPLSDGKTEPRSVNKSLEQWRFSERKTDGRTWAPDEVRDATSRAAAALQSLRDAKESGSRMRAIDELERALQELRRDLQKDERRH